jgi:hypothetical protein
VYENDPELSDVGAVSEKVESDKLYTPDLGPRVNWPNVGGKLMFLIFRLIYSLNK